MTRGSDEPDECSICGTPTTETNLGWSGDLEALACVACLLNSPDLTQYRIPVSEPEPEPEPEVSRSWCPRCGERIKDHATATVDDENHWICPVDERAVEEEHPQEQLGSFGVSDDSSTNQEETDT